MPNAARRSSVGEICLWASALWRPRLCMAHQVVALISCVTWRSEAILPARKVAEVSLFGRQVDHLAKAEMDQPGGEFLCADARQTGLTRDGGILRHRAGRGRFFGWQIDIRQERTSLCLACRPSIAALPFLVIDGTRKPQ